MTRQELKIVSGGQTGVDQGALEAALDLGLVWGGWVPKGWRAENGTVPEHFRARMQEHVSANYIVRTRQNVAGPRESKSAGIQSRTRLFLTEVLGGMLEG